MDSANYWIKALKLVPHPEGGCYRETYRSSTMTEPAGFKDGRSICTAIFFLLQGKEVSRLHRMRSDELWHFHCGSSLSLHIISPDGAYRLLQLGPDAEAGEHFQACIPAGCWFGATVNEPNSYSLIGCTVAPGFEFRDFELAAKGDLLAVYPKHKAIIEQLTSP